MSINGIPSVENMQSPQTNKPVANQYIMKGLDACLIDGEALNSPEIFQSYETIICVWGYRPDGAGRMIYLDRDKWDYSVTTLKYLKVFLDLHGIDQLREGIKSGEYQLTELN